MPAPSRQFRANDQRSGGSAECLRRKFPDLPVPQRVRSGADWEVGATARSVTIVIAICCCKIMALSQPAARAAVKQRVRETERFSLSSSGGEGRGEEALTG